MTFIIDTLAKKNQGTLFYFKEGYAFDFKPYPGVGITLEFGHLLLEFDPESGCATHLWGLNPHLGWINKKLIKPKAIDGCLKLKNIQNITIQPGVALKIMEASKWNTYYDEEKGWICFGSFLIDSADEAVEFANGIIAVIANKKIKALWMHPTILDSDKS